MSDQLLTLYREATPDQIARGRAWYPTYRRECDGIARQHATPLRRVVATAAITSPCAQLASNIAWTREATAANGAVNVGRYPNVMRAKYEPILTGNVRPLDGVGGLKVTNFYRAIMGDPTAVVLDRHALRAVGHDKDTCTDRQYAEYVQVYSEAAHTVGESPRDFQAIVWTVLRERGRAKLQDIHDLREAA